MSSVLLNLQTEVANVLSSTPSLTGIPVLAEDPYDIDYEVAHAIAALELAVIVGQPEVRQQNPRERAPRYDVIDLTVRVEENPRLRGDLEPTRIAEHVMAALHLHRLDAIDEPLYAAPEAVGVINERGTIAYAVRLTTEPPRG